MVRPGALVDQEYARRLLRSEVRVRELMDGAHPDAVTQTLAYLRDPARRRLIRKFPPIPLAKIGAVGFLTSHLPARDKVQSARVILSHFNNKIDGKRDSQLDDASLLANTLRRSGGRVSFAQALGGAPSFVLGTIDLRSFVRMSEVQICQLKVSSLVLEQIVAIDPKGSDSLLLQIIQDPSHLFVKNHAISLLSRETLIKFLKGTAKVRSLVYTQDLAADSLGLESDFSPSLPTMVRCRSYLTRRQGFPAKPVLSAKDLFQVAISKQATKFTRCAALECIRSAFVPRLT